MHDVTASAVVVADRSTTSVAMKDQSAVEMMEEMELLRKRIQELERQERNSSPSIESQGSNASASELSGLRKDIARLNDEKAKQEMDFMNQISQIAQAHQEEMAVLKHKVSTYEERSHRATQVTITGNTIEASELLAQQSEAMKQLKSDLASADKELKVTRADMKEMSQKVQEADSIKAALLQEVTDVKVQLEQAEREKAALNDNILDIEKHYNEKFMTMEDDLAERHTLDNRRDHEMAEMNDEIIKLEGQKEMLMEEITDLRLQMNRDEKSRLELKSELERMRKEGATSDTARGNVSRIMDLEKEKEILEQEMCGMTKTHKLETTVLEEMVEKAQEERKVALEDLTQANLKLNQTEDQKATLKGSLDEAHRIMTNQEKIIATLESQRIEYEQRTSEAIMVYMDEVDSSKAECSKLKVEVEQLKTELEQHRRVVTPTATTSRQVVFNPSRGSSRGPTDGVRGQPPAVISQKPPTAAHVIPAKRSPSRGRGSVLALAATFEQRANAPSSVAPSEASEASSDSGGPQLYQRRSFHPPNRGQASHGAPPLEIVQQSEPNDLPALRAELDEKITTISLLHSELEDRSAQLEALQSRFKEELAARTTEVNELRGLLEEGAQQNKELEHRVQQQELEIEELRNDLESVGEKKTAVASMKLKHYEAKYLEDQGEIDRLMRQIEETCQELNQERRKVNELEEAIKSLNNERMEYQERANTVATAEADQRNKKYHREIDGLKTQLTNELSEKSRLSVAHKNQIAEFEATIEELNRECDSELEEKQRELDQVRNQVSEMNAEMERIRLEKEQLCVSMNGAQNKRKGELDEIQAELMAKTAKTNELSREVQSLQMQVDFQKDQSRELEQLRKKVKQMEAKGNTATAMHMKNQEVDDLVRENQRLRESVRKSAIEKRAMQEKVNSMVTDQGQSTSLKVLRERNAALKKEVERLSGKLRKYVKPKITRVEL